MTTTKTTAYKQLVIPNFYIEGNAGFSLQYVQDAFNAPRQHFSAWEAWEDAKYKHLTQDADFAFPDAYVPVYFRSIYDGHNYGHIGIWDPQEQAIHTTPYGGYGKIVIPVEVIEKKSGGKSVCVGWSEDLNGLRIVRIPGKHAF